MNKIDWKSKFTSRKFWAAVIGFVSAMMVAFKVNNLTIEQVVSVISACSVLIAYILGEGMVDSSRIESDTSTTETNATESESEK
jgi:uncharacterized membrane protein